MSDDVPLSPIPPPQRLGPAPQPSYRPARAQQRGLDPATRGMAIGAGCIIALLLLLVAGWAITGRHGGTVPLITADKQPWRVVPANPGGMQVAGAYEAEDMPDQHGATAPTPESPSPEALRAAQPEPPPAPAQIQALPGAPSGGAPDQIAAAAAPNATPPPAAPSDAAPPHAIQAQPAPAPSPPPAAAAPARPSAVPQLSAPARAVPNLSAGGTFVQLAALDSEAGARTEWQRIKGRMADVIADRQPVLQRAERNGHTVWRLRIGGFSSIADATRFCEHVRAKGGTCELATF